VSTDITVPGRPVGEEGSKDLDLAGKNAIIGGNVVETPCHALIPVLIDLSYCGLPLSSRLTGLVILSRKQNHKSHGSFDNYGLP
jgi:hypothetical protein